MLRTAKQTSTFRFAGVRPHFGCCCFTSVFLAALPILLPFLGVAQAAEAQLLPESWGYHVAAGPSRYIYNIGEPEEVRYWGGTIRTGVNIGAYAAGAQISHWRRSSGSLRWAVEVNGEASFLHDKPVSLQLFSTVGQSFISSPGLAGSSGLAMSYGTGLSLNAFRPLVIRPGVFVRLDQTAWDTGYDVLIRWDARASTLRSPPIQLLGAVSWMYTLRGPWRAVEPSYSIGLSQPVSEKIDATYSVTLLHWQIPRDAWPGYIWDTRGFISRFLIDWNVHGPFSMAGGPSFLLMGEGPDVGVRVGSFARLGWSVPVVPLSLQVGLLWFSREPGTHTSVPGEDLAAGTIQVQFRI